MEPLLAFFLLRPAHAATATATVAAASRPSSLAPAHRAALLQRRSFRSAPCVRRQDIANEAINDHYEHNEAQDEDSTPRKKPRRMRYRIAAAASAKGSGVALDRNVYPFLPRHHHAIGVQRLAPDAAQRRASRPDSGEDAFFVSKVGVEGWKETAADDSEDGHALAFGVADGVGGWANSGVDPADFSHALCAHMADAALGWKPPAPGQRLTGRRLIQLGYEASLRDKAIFAGGSTASLGLAWESGLLELTNLGDSGSMLFRNAAVHHYSPPQTHDFNTPYQLTVMPPRARSQSAIFGGRPFDDLPAAADVSTWRMRHGDVVLLATDGVFDNLFRADLLRIVTAAMVTSGAWVVDPARPPTVANHLDALTQPGGVDLAAFIPGAKTADGTAQPSAAAAATAADGPLAGLDSLLQPSLQSLLALSVVVQAKLASLNARRDGPFAKEAQRHRPAERWRGGKVDDTTAVVMVAVEEGKGCT